MFSNVHRFISILVIFLSSTLLAQAPDTLWTRTYGGSGGDILYSVHQTADGGFIMSGTAGINADSIDGWLVRTKADGDTLWTRTYGDPGDKNECQSGQLTFDGGFIMVTRGEMWLIRTDENGDTLWTRSTGGPDGNDPLQVVQTADSGYVVLGVKMIDFEYTVTLFKINALGAAEWIKSYKKQSATSVQQTLDGGYIIIGDSRGGSGERFIRLIKTDANGDTTWTNTFTLGEGGSNVVRQTADGGYAIFGVINGTLSVPDDAAPQDWLLIKTDSSGTLQWSQTYGGVGNDQSFDMIIPSDGGYLLTGWLDPTGTGDDIDLWLVKTDSLGDTLWTTTVAGIGSEGGIGLLELDEGEYAVVGFTGSFDTGEIDGWLLRFGDTTAVSTTPAGTGVPEAFALHANYPNPFNPATTVGFDLPVAAVVSLTVYDILGREVRQLINRPFVSGYHRAVWDGRTNRGQPAPTGIYFARISAADYSRTIKMLLLK